MIKPTVGRSGGSLGKTPSFWRVAPRYGDWSAVTAPASGRWYYGFVVALCLVVVATVLVKLATPQSWHGAP